ncbi:PDDEXK family nuclease [Alkalibacillus haloalkaliphilus]|uniref:Uncharacterized protein n=1 Tax=Alkalibacillus haloalkaliphilus TaxID=94136 RepID=A0A511W150_9BACI|nr:hypothetical protein [Alkalibacillus haloalkaliphilus]GEN44471.1 hypothetical protein AHA02nite_02470 [Alkalibacillus haloalkaliphilus]
MKPEEKYNKDLQALNNKQRELLNYNLKNHQQIAYEVEKLNFYSGYDVDTLTGVKTDNPNIQVIKNKVLSKKLIELINENNKKNVVKLQIRTIQLNKNYKQKENMVLEQVDFNDLIEKPWSSSYLNKKFKNTIFVFLVFMKSNGLHFVGCKLWKMNPALVELEIKKFWERTIKIVENGVELKQENNKIKNNLPKSNEHRILHVRPKAKDSQDKYQLPDGKYITKQGFWINNSYISKIGREFAAEINFQKENNRQILNNGSNKINVKDGIYDTNSNEFKLLASSRYSNHDSLYQLNEEVIVYNGNGIPTRELIIDYINKNKIINKNSVVYLKPEYKSIINDLHKNRILYRFNSEKFITSEYLAEKGINSSEMERLSLELDYKLKDFNSKSFFTINKVRDLLDGNIVIEAGMSDEFIEDVLLDSHLFHYLKVNNKFIFSNFDSTYDDFLDIVTNSEFELNLDRLVALVNSNISNIFYREDVLEIVRRSSYYYSSHINAVFKSKNQFYKTIYGG